MTMSGTPISHSKIPAMMFLLSHDVLKEEQSHRYFVPFLHKFSAKNKRERGMIMARTQGIALTEVEEEVVVVPGAGLSGPASDWGAIVGGTLGAIVVSIILFTAGSGFGVSTVEPWSFANHAPETFVIGAGIWLIIMQWLSAAFGGYLAGRMRSKLSGLRTDEVLFRDTAHGFLAWALATVIVAALFAFATGVGAAAAPGAAVAVAPLSEAAREAAANFSIFTAISLLVGGFIAAAAGGLGGYHRDAL